MSATLAADIEPFYVSVIDGKRTALLLGPFPTHEDALRHVDHANAVAYQVDPKSWFYSYGTVRMAAGFNKPGILNNIGLSLK